MVDNEIQRKPTAGHQTLSAWPAPLGVNSRPNELSTDCWTLKPSSPRLHSRSRRNIASHEARFRSAWMASVTDLIRRQTAMAVDVISIWKIQPSRIRRGGGAAGCGNVDHAALWSPGPAATSARSESLSWQTVSGATQTTSASCSKPTLLPWLNVRKNVLSPAQNKVALWPGRMSSAPTSYWRMAAWNACRENCRCQAAAAMQQRSGIVRAAVLNPDITVMDGTLLRTGSMTREQIGFGSAEDLR